MTGLLKRDGSFEYPQNMFWLRNKTFIFSLRTLNEKPDIPLLCLVSILPIFFHTPALYLIKQNSWGLILLKVNLSSSTSLLCIL